MSETTSLSLPCAPAIRMTAAPACDPAELAYAGFLSRYKPRTRATYKFHLDQWLRWLAAQGKHPFDVRRPHIEVYMRHLEEERGLADATRYSRLGVIHGYYATAVRDELLEKNPAEHVAKPKIDASAQRRTWLPLLESLALLKAASQEGPNAHVLVALMSIDGMRVGATCALSVSDVRRSGGWWTVTYVGKGGKQCTDVVPPQVVPDLQKLLENRAGEEPLLRNARGRRMERRSVTTVLRRLCAKAEITRDLTPHGLRRSAATNMLAQKVDPRDVQRQLHHADLRTTLRVYDQLKPSLDRSASIGYAASLYEMLDAS